VHNKASAKLARGVPGRRFVKERLLTTSVDAGWGDLNAVSATIQSFGEILSRCSSVQHIAVVIGKDVPVQALNKHNMPKPGSSYISNFPAEDIAKWQSLLHSKTKLPKAYISGLAFHHNWAIYSRPAALALVYNHHTTMAMAEQLLPLKDDMNFRIDLDEIAPLTTLHYLGYRSSIQPVSVTALLYLTGEFCPPHPITWSDMDTEVNTTSYSWPMSLHKLLIILRARQNRGSTFLFLRKVQVQRAAQAHKLLHELQQLWAASQADNIGRAR
jgi:hypothetical protein